MVVELQPDLSEMTTHTIGFSGGYRVRIVVRQKLRYYTPEARGTTPLSPTPPVDGIPTPTMLQPRRPRQDLRRDNSIHLPSDDFVASLAVNVSSRYEDTAIVFTHEVDRINYRYA